MIAEAVAVAFWVMLPAYVPNNAAVLAGGGVPIDGGRTRDGRRLLGDGKTWRGTAIGVIAGALVALGLNIVHSTAVSGIGVAFPVFPPVTVLSIPLGAMLGDIGASFIKRASGRGRGAAFPVLDQLDFVAGALILTVLVAPTWLLESITPVIFAIILLMTPLLHVGTNIGAYLLGLKDEPY